ncbi:MerR family transcriptional regulator [Oscillospiraceae bacterium 52-8]
MGQKKQLSILEFSRLTGIARDNLRFYDRIGLLKPALRGDNGYRYYTRHQLGSAYLISSLRLLGVGLEEIRRYSADRTPDKMLALFADQEARIQAEIARLREASEIMERYANMAREALYHRESQFLVEERKRERIFLCPPTPAVADTDEAEILAYECAIGHGINPGYPLGALIPREGFPPAAKNPPYRYYFMAGQGGNAWKPAGLYAVAYATGKGDDAPHLCQRLLDFVRERGLAVAGDAYGQYLLDDLAVQTPELYCSRLEILVERRAGEG